MNLKTYYLNCDLLHHEVLFILGFSEFESRRERTHINSLPETHFLLYRSLSHSIETSFLTLFKFTHLID